MSMPTVVTGGSSTCDAARSWAMRELRPEQSTTRSAGRCSPSTTTPVTRRAATVTALDRHAVLDRHAGQGRHPRPHDVLEQRPRHAQTPGRPQSPRAR